MNEIITFGYARVSTDDQNLDLQRDALAKAGCTRIFEEKISATRALRPQLEECLRNLRAGDKLIVWRLDRLGRSLSDLVSIIGDLMKRDIVFESLTERIETSSATGKLMFHLIAALAEFEHNVIKERTRAGVTAARARGRVGGRKPKVTAKMKCEMKALYDSKNVSVGDICARYDITKPTFYRVVLERDYTTTGVKA